MEKKMTTNWLLAVILAAVAIMAFASADLSRCGFFGKKSIVVSVWEKITNSKPAPPLAQKIEVEDIGWREIEGKLEAPGFPAAIMRVGNLPSGEKVKALLVLVPPSESRGVRMIKKNGDKAYAYVILLHNNSATPYVVKSCGSQEELNQTPLTCGPMFSPMAKASI